MEVIMRVRVPTLFTEDCIRGCSREVGEVLSHPLELSFTTVRFSRGIGEYLVIFNWLMEG